MKSEGCDTIGIFIGEAEELTIDWGDASESKLYDRDTFYCEDGEVDIMYRYEHIYSTKTSHTVTITGTDITYLDCGDNQLTDLDVSRNTALTSLYCGGNKLEKLDVSRNTALTHLGCTNTQITNLDVSKNTALEKLYCHNNHLTNLDVSRNTALIGLYCYNNQLTDLDVSRNTALEVLLCSNNKLTYLDLSKNTVLRYLNFANNQFSADALNALFETLPDNIMDYKIVVIAQNPGTDACNIKIAKDKIWIVKTSDKP
jgi:uncharacterized protein